MEIHSSSILFSFQCNIERDVKLADTCLVVIVITVYNKHVTIYAVAKPQPDVFK